MGKHFNIAILGAGNIAGSMAEALKGISDEVTMYAVGSRSLAKAEAFAKKFGFEKAYGSYEELVADEAIDLIYVATPHSEHFANTKLCLEMGRNCLVEKAFCGNRAQSEELIRIAKDRGIFLAEAMWTRYMPVVEEIKGILSSGELGTVHYLESDFSVPIPGVERMVNPALAGGALLDLGVYSITMPAMFLGTEITRVEVDVTKHESGVDATEVVTFTYPNGTTARCKASFVDCMSNYCRIVGSKGDMEFGPINVPEYIRICNPEGELLREIPVKMMVNGYEYEVLSSKNAILAGKLETPEMPWAETLRMMGWMDSLRVYMGVEYPFETEADRTHPDAEVWGPQFNEK